MFKKKEKAPEKAKTLQIEFEPICKEYIFDNKDPYYRFFEPLPADPIAAVKENDKREKEYREYYSKKKAVLNESNKGYADELKENFWTFAFENVDEEPEKVTEKSQKDNSAAIQKQNNKMIKKALKLRAKEEAKRKKQKSKEKIG